MASKKEFGDFQTPIPLARQVVGLIDQKYGVPNRVIEPTCGLGNFLEAAHDLWGTESSYSGYEINDAYSTSATARLPGYVKINQADFFLCYWKDLLQPKASSYTLVLGNPPWVTNATLGSMNSTNLPNKSNFQCLRGLDAKTGKANFDIAEWIIIHLVESMPQQNVLAMLCKTATARKVLCHFWRNDIPVCDEQLYLIDAKKSFDVSVDACLLIIRKGEGVESFASIFDSMKNKSIISRFSLLNGELVANIDDYSKHKNLDGFSNYRWRSGIKHDASKVMELSREADGFFNAYGEECRIEEKLIYPLLKSSDLGNGRLTPRKHVIVTQNKAGDSTEYIKQVAPKTWDYLVSHGNILDSRKSSIYKKRPRFCMFGIGEYSFSPWKVGISGLYKKLRFVAIPPFEGKPMMVDDTCYFFPCRSEREAKLWEGLLNSTECMNFLHSLVFFDAKRPVNVDVLKRINFFELARMFDKHNEAKNFLSMPYGCYENKQSLLVFEEKQEHQF
jgi:hypothetical protein